MPPKLHIFVILKHLTKAERAAIEEASANAGEVSFYGLKQGQPHPEPPKKIGRPRKKKPDEPQPPPPPKIKILFIEKPLTKAETITLSNSPDTSTDVRFFAPEAKKPKRGARRAPKKQADELPPFQTQYIEAFKEAAAAKGIMDRLRKDADIYKEELNAHAEGKDVEGFNKLRHKRAVINKRRIDIDAYGEQIEKLKEGKQAAIDFNTQKLKEAREKYATAVAQFRKANEFMDKHPEFKTLPIDVD
jgi:hypothetical protein